MHIVYGCGFDTRNINIQVIQATIRTLICFPVPNDAVIAIRNKTNNCIVVIVTL